MKFLGAASFQNAGVCWLEQPKEEVANFRFPIAKGEKDLASLTTSFARFVGSWVWRPCHGILVHPASKSDRMKSRAWCHPYPVSYQEVMPQSSNENNWKWNVFFHSICLEPNFLFTVSTDLVPMPTADIPKVNIALGRSIPSTVSDSFFISLTAADYSKVAPEVLRSAASNADTLEFRVDLLENWEPENVVHQARTFLSGRTSEQL